MTDRTAHKWNWVLGLSMVLMVIWSIRHDYNDYDELSKEAKLHVAKTYEIIIKKVNTGETIRLYYPQDTTNAKVDSAVYKLFEAVGKSIGDGVKK